MTLNSQSTTGHNAPTAQPLPEQLDMTGVRRLLTLADKGQAALDGHGVPTRQARRSRTAELAVTSKELLYLAHLLDKSRVLVMDEYHVVRGRTEQLLRDTPGKVT